MGTWIIGFIAALSKKPVFAGLSCPFARTGSLREVFPVQCMRLPPPANQELILNKKAYPPKTKEILRKKPVFAGLLCPFARTGGPQKVFPVQCMRLPPPANQELILNKKAYPPKIKKERIKMKQKQLCTMPQNRY